MLMVHLFASSYSMVWECIVVLYVVLHHTELLVLFLLLLRQSLPLCWSSSIMYCMVQEGLIHLVMIAGDGECLHWYSRRNTDY